MPSSSHVSNINHTVLLQALATQGAGFGTVTLFVDQAAGNPLSGGARFQDFFSVDDADAAQVAGEISAGTVDIIDVAFAQRVQPAKFRVCRIDTAGGESHADALTALRAEGLSDVWMLVTDSRTVSEQLNLAAAVETYGGEHACMLQSNDADWLTGGFPGAWSAIEENVWTAMVYHDSTAEFLDVACAVRNLAFDPDETSVPWEKDVAGVAAYTSYVPPAQRNFAFTNNIAIMGTWGSSDYWVDRVVSQEGRPLKELLTASWYKARVNESIQTMHQRELAAGRAVLVSQQGMSQLVGAIESVNGTAVAAGHFNPGQVVTTPQPITDADISNQRLRATTEAQVGTGARVFTITSNLSQTAVVAE